MSKLVKKKAKSDYQKDIISLTGIDFDAIPKSKLLLVTNMFLNSAPMVTDRRLLLNNDEIKHLIKREMGLETLGRKALKEESKMELICETFKKNYRKRRSAKMCCGFRSNFLSFQSLVLIDPVISPEREEKLINNLKKHFPFTLLCDNTVQLMFLAMSKFTIRSGLFLVKEGDFSTRMFYIESGLFGSVLYDDKCYVTEYIKPGSCLGCDRLFFGNTVTKSIKCLNSGVVWFLEAKHFNSVCHWGLIERDSFLYDVISNASGISGPSAYKLINSLQRIILGPNKEILDNAKETALFIVYKGEVEVKLLDKRDNIYEHTKKVGEVFGSDRLFTGRFSQLISAVTLTPVELYYVPQQVFERLFDTSDLYVNFDLDPKHDDYLFYKKL